ncbi:MAG: hypothetical protein ACLT2W_12870, partial [Intestinibacter bartlettii]
IYKYKYKIKNEGIMVKNYVNEIKKLNKKAEVNRACYSDLHKLYKLLDNLINIVVIISSAIVAILTFADIEYFRIIFKYINQESFTLLVGILASIIFIITLVQQYLNLSTKSDESEIAIKRITNFIRDTSSLKNEENIDEKKFNQILEDYKKINEENPVIPDYIFIRAKSKLNQKIQISRYIDKYPMKKIRHIKKELRNKSIEEIDKLLE